MKQARTLAPSRDLAFRTGATGASHLVSRCLAPAALTTLLVFSIDAFAQTGVSDDRVSLPDGPGSLDGVGDNASVNANMGHMQTSIPIEVPPGFEGLTPDFTLSYSSGGGSGVVGMGWSMPTPAIERMTAKGLPDYDADDLFVANGSEELVRISAGEPAVYRARYEGGFRRYKWYDRGTGDAGYWTAEFPDGRIATYGATADGTPAETARVRSPDGIFRFLLTEVQDRYAHRLTYDYRYYGAVPLLDFVAWAYDDNDTPRYTVTFDYEDRIDRVSDARGGFNELLASRLSSVRIFSSQTITRRYNLNYEDYTTSNSVSRLVRVERTGADGGIYPVVNTIEYSRALAGVCDPQDCEEPLLVDAGNIGASFATGRVNLIDLNGDSIPDAIESPPVGAHLIYLGQMDADGSVSFAAPFESAVGDAGTFELSSPFVQVLDADGDGFTDLLNSLNGRVLVNKGEGDWTEVATIAGASGDLPDFSEDFALDEDGQLEHIRFIDVNADRRIDVLRSDEVGTSLFLNQGELGFVSDPNVEPLEAGFADDSTDLADMNGDGLLDPVQIREGLLRYRTHLGRGKWTQWTNITGAPIAFEEIPFTSLEDLNGDGIDDLVAVIGGEVRYAINQNSANFTTVESLTQTRGQPLPVDDGTVTVLYADMNANGSTDVVWIDDDGNVTYLDLFPVRPHLLSRFDNGIGYTVDVTYGAMALERALSNEADWADPVPMPTLVVKSLDVYTDSPDPDLIVHELVSYAYEGGYYDGVEKQFRGFRTARQTEESDRGDVVLTQTFDVGAGDNRGHFAGKSLSDELREGDALLRTTMSTYEECALSGIPDVAQLRVPIAFACLTSEDTLLQEGRPFAEWAHVREETEYDGYGNTTFTHERGVVDIGGAGCAPCTRLNGVNGAPCGEQCEGDERTVEVSFIAPETNADRWILGLVQEAKEYTVAGGLSKVEANFYDGEPFTGLPAGAATHGSLTRQTRLAVVGEAPIQAIRARFDLHGNIVERIAPSGPANGSHRVRSQYDAAGLNLVRLEQDIDNGGDALTLAQDITYDPLFNEPATATEWYRVGEDPSSTKTAWNYDEHGRLISTTRPGESIADATTSELEYDLKAPYSRIIERIRSDKDGGLDLETITCLDGLGREIQTRQRTAEGRYQISGLRVLDRQGNPTRLFLDNVSAQSACLPPAPDAPFTELSYDALDREVLVTHADADERTDASFRRVEFLPLTTRFWNEDDNDETSVGFNSPNLVEVDGLGRIVALERTLAGGESERHEIYYDGLGRISGAKDPDGNEKTQTYDLVDRIVEVVDPDSNTTTFAYDADGNVIQSEDARGVVTRRSYDALGRLVEEWNDADRAGTLVEYFYDRSSACTSCANQANHLVGTQYQSPLGQVRESMEFNARGELTAHTQTIGGIDLRIENEYDNAGRLTSVLYPDGQRVRSEFDDASRVTSVGGVATGITYDDMGLMSGWSQTGDVRVEFSHSNRAAVTGIKASVGATSIVDLAFARDRLENIIDIQDEARVGAGSQNATIEYDALGCVSRVTYDDERLEFQSDRLQRIVQKVSDRGALSVAHVGTMTYATARRLSRAGDVEWAFDASGYTTERGADAFKYDHNGRMIEVTRQGSAVIDIARAPTGERVVTRENASVRVAMGTSFEVRDGISRVTLRVADQIVALLESDALASTFYADANGDGAITGADAYAARGDSDQGAMLLSAARRALLSVQGEVTTLLSDSRGSTIAVVGEDGGLRESFAYYPYGGIRSSSAVQSEFARFTGREHDGSGYLDFNTRVLSPREGRWLSPDPAFLQITRRLVDAPVDAFSAYAYVANDPINFVDRDGRQGNKTGLPNNLKAGIENLSGVSLDNVRVHYNSPAPAQLQAHAYAQGTRIHLASGQAHSPPHELAHVLQQRQGRVRPTTSVNGSTPSSPSPSSASPNATASVTSGGLTSTSNTQPSATPRPATNAPATSPTAASNGAISSAATNAVRKPNRSAKVAKNKSKRGKKGSKAGSRRKGKLKGKGKGSKNRGVQKKAARAKRGK